MPHPQEGPQRWRARAKPLSPPTALSGWPEHRAEQPTLVRAIQEGGGLAEGL